MQSFLKSPVGLRVVVADDIAASREASARLVQQLGHVALVAASGTAALELIRQADPDVVLLDLLMPDMDGFAVTQKVREWVTHRWLPVIVTSSLDGEEHFIHALQRGADDYLVRPINPDLLSAKLRHYGRVLGLQSRLAALASRQRAIQDNILDMVVTLDAQGLVEDANLATCRCYGLGREVLLGQPCAQVLGVSLEQLLSSSEVPLRRSDGSSFPAEVAWSAWQEGARTLHTLVLRDLTERRHMERMKDEFLATVSHELRTPLTSIVGALGLLGSGAAGELPKAARPMAEMAKRNAERLSHLIDDILDLTKLEGNRMSLRLRPLLLQPLLREALAANQGYAARASVALHLQDDAAAPAVRIDPDRFLQIMANLLSNAIKHSPAQGRVTVELLWHAPEVQVRVSDQGPGIAPAFRSRIFEKFSQADGSDARVQGGTGLGLYITRTLLERMGASVSIDDSVARGACFVLHFPTADAAAQPVTPCITLIDRDLDARRRVAEWLAPLCSVDACNDLSQLQPAPARVVLADPQSQGPAEDFCAAVHARCPNAQVLLYSDAVDASFARSQQLPWIAKTGTTRETLLRAVQTALHQAHKEPHP